MKLEVSKDANRVVNSSLILSGVPRTGTTILGNLLGSVESSCYFFEPPMVRLIMALHYHDELSDGLFRLLLSNYCYEELLMPSLAGRNLNFNQNDDSFIKKYLTDTEMDKRMSKSWRKNEIIREAQNYRLIFKIPSVMTHLVKFHTVFSEAELLITIREPFATIKSMVVKGWFTDEAITNDLVIHPHYSYNSYLIPEAIPSEVAPEFIESDEWTRAALYYYHLNNAVFKLTCCKIIDYDRFVIKPKSHIEKLLLDFQLEPTVRTEEIISSVDPRASNNEGIKNLVDKSIFGKVENLYSSLLERAMSF